MGPKTAAVVVQAHKGQVPEYLAKLEQDLAELRAGRAPAVRVPQSDEDCLPTAQEEISSILGLNPGAGI